MSPSCSSCGGKPILKVSISIIIFLRLEDIIYKFNIIV